MTLFVRNNCYGGFGLSKQAVRLFNQYAETAYESSCELQYEVPRNDPNLVKVVEELVEAASEDYAELIIVEVPSDVSPEIQDYDGWETFVEPHRTW